jgi:hypothetical protein
VIGAVELVADAPATPAPDRRGVVDRLLSGPSALIDDAVQADGATQAQVVRVLLLTILAGTAAFGAAVGFTRGGVQVLYAALKLPLVVLLTAAVSTPALTALSLALGRQTDLRRDLLRVLTALGRGSLVLAALSPVMLVASSLRAPYHQAVLLCVGCCAVAGGVGLPPLLGALWAERRGRFFLIGAMITVVVMAGTHTAWLFRPYIVRPQSTTVPFLRDLDGTFTDSVTRSTRSARGIYDVRPEVRR